MSVAPFQTPHPSGLTVQLEAYQLPHLDVCALAGRARLCTRVDSIRTGWNSVLGWGEANNIPRKEKTVWNFRG
jgi:hypothetical protein